MKSEVTDKPISCHKINIQEKTSHIGALLTCESYVSMVI